MSQKMSIITKKQILILIISLILIFLSMTKLGRACSRAVYLGKEGQTVTGRSMDWSEDMKSNFYLFPRGMKKNGGADKNSLEWVSKYGSVITSVYEGATSDGMNEKGLVTNLLYLAESKYPDNKSNKPVVYVSAWAQYVLDNYSTVKEAVEDLRKEKFIVKTATVPNGKAGSVHLSISDPSGDSAIFEYVDGKLVIHHGKEFQIMTNSPLYDEQLAIEKYWKEIGSENLLLGTARAADRYVRAAYYINASGQTSDANEAVATVASVIRNASVPRGVINPVSSNLSETIWRTYADQKNKIYFFEDTAYPSIVWVDLKQLDFTSGTKVRKIQLSGNRKLSGDITDKFMESKPFTFIVN